MKEPFWGQRATQSKGMRVDTRLIWHYFTWHKTWANGEDYFTVCRGSFSDSQYHTLQKSNLKPLGKDCCSACQVIFNKRLKEAQLND